MKNNPINFNDPTGHKECDDEKGCGGTLPKLNRTPPSTGGGGNGGRNKDDRNDDPLPPNNVAPSNNLEISGSGVIGDKGYEGYSDPDIDALYFWWENFLTPVNDIVSLDDIYRISSRGGWKAGRYSLNLGILEAIVQGSRQAYRDSWHQNLTPTQRFLRPIVVGGEALVTDAAAGLAGKGFGAAGLSVGGPLGLAGGYLAGQTFTTNVMDRVWMEDFNPWAFDQLGEWP